MILTPELMGDLCFDVSLLSENHENYVLKEGDPGGCHIPFSGVPLLLSNITIKALCLYFQSELTLFSVLCFLVADGEKLEKEMNDKGPGEACLIKCDVTKEEDIKVSVLCFLETLQSEVIIIC